MRRPNNCVFYLCPKGVGAAAQIMNLVDTACDRRKTEEDKVHALLSRVSTGRDFGDQEVYNRS